MYLYNLTVLLGRYEKNEDHNSQITELFVIGFIHSVFDAQTALSAGLLTPMALKGKLRLSTFKSFAQRTGPAGIAGQDKIYALRRLYLSASEALKL